MALKGNKYEKELEVAIAAVGEAALITKAVQVNIDKSALEKKDRSPVTIADFGSQALICRMVNEAFPDDPIIAEEDSKALKEPGNAEILEKLIERVQAIKPDVEAEAICKWIDIGGAEEYSKRFWTLDPIDGTKGFLRGAQYAIALGLIVEGELTVAALGCPNLPFDPEDPAAGDTCFFAIRGEGAFTAPLGGSGEAKPAKASDVVDTRDIRFCESYEAAHSSHGDAANIAKQLEIAADPVRIDSQAKYGLVARGEGDAYLRLPRDGVYREKIWDHAAGALIVSEAGGRVTDIRGRSLDFTHGKKLEQNMGIIASNGNVHDKILEAIESLGIGKF